MKTTSLLVSAPLALLLSGCVTFPGAGSTPKIDPMATLEKRVAKNEETLSELTHRLSVLQFMADGHERQLRKAPAATQEPVSETPLLAPEPASSRSESAPAADAVPEKPDQLYDSAFSALKARKYDKAAKRFQTLAQTFPEHSLADNSLYWLGECKYAQSDYDGAISEFRNLVKAYPEGGKVPDALLKIGYAAIQKGDIELGKTTLKQVISDHPFSEAAAKAEAKLKTLF